jgi:hypothetical protein
MADLEPPHLDAGVRLASLQRVEWLARGPRPLHVQLLLKGWGPLAVTESLGRAIEVLLVTRPGTLEVLARVQTLQLCVNMISVVTTTYCGWKISAIDRRHRHGEK